MTTDPFDGINPTRLALAIGDAAGDFTASRHVMPLTSPLAANDRATAFARRVVEKYRKRTADADRITAGYEKVDIEIEGATGRVYTYESLTGKLRVGDRVIVPFGAVDGLKVGTVKVVNSDRDPGMPLKRVTGLVFPLGMVARTSPPVTSFRGLRLTPLDKNGMPVASIADEVFVDY